MKKLVSLLLTFTLLFCLIGCSEEAAEKKNSGVASIMTADTGYGTLSATDGTPVNVTIDWSLYEYFVRYRMLNALNNGYDVETLKTDLAAIQQDDMTGAQLLKESCLEDLKYYYGIHILAEEHNISLTDAEKQTLADEKSSLVQSYGGEEAFQTTLADNYMTEANYDFIQETNALYSKLLTALYGEGGVHAIALDDVVADVSENYVRVVHILIQADANSADFAEKTTYANEVLARANAGEDFMTLVSELSEDPGSQSQPDGYIFDKEGYTMDGNSMMQEFVDGSWALEVGQHSGLVQTSYGYHIIKRLPLDKEYISANYDQFHSYSASVALSGELFGLIDALEITTTDAFAALDMLAFIPEIETVEAPAAE